MKWSSGLDYDRVELTFVEVICLLIGMTIKKAGCPVMVSRKGFFK